MKEKYPFLLHRTVLWFETLAQSPKNTYSEKNGNNNKNNREFHN